MISPKYGFAYKDRKDYNRKVGSCRYAIDEEFRKKNLYYRKQYRINNPEDQESVNARLRMYSKLNKKYRLKKIKMSRQWRKKNHDWCLEIYKLRHHTKRLKQRFDAIGNLLCLEVI